MLKVAIVGNIASGKSTIEKILEGKKFKVYDTDKIAHEILAVDEDVKKIFGTNDRKEIAKIVFEDSQKLKLLESIIHPQVKAELNKIFSTNNNDEVVFVSVPQLYEAGFESLFDKIIYITADEKIRQNRLIKRNSFSPEEAKKRIDAQVEGEKRKKSDFVIENNSSIEDLEKSISGILSILI